MIAKHLTYTDCLCWGGLWDYTLKPAPSLFPDMPKGHRKSLLKAGISLEGECKFSEESDLYLKAIMLPVKDWETGLRGVLHLFFKALDDALFAPIEDVNKMKKYNLQLKIHEVMLSAGKVNINNAYDKFSLAAQNIRRNTNWEDYSREVGHIMNMRELHSHRRKMREIAREGPDYVKKHPARGLYPVTSLTSVKDVEIHNFPENLFSIVCHWTVTHYEGLYFWSPKKSAKTMVGSILTEKDMLKLKLCLTTYMNGLIAGDFMHSQHGTSSYKRAHAFLWGSYRKLFDSGGNVHRFCEAWDQAYKAHLAKIAGPLSNEAFLTLEKDYIAKGFHNIISLRSFELAVKDYSVVATVANMNAHRALPPPDYDLPGCFSEEKVLHSSKNPYGETKEDASVVSDFKAYMRLHAVRSLGNKNGFLPGVIKDEYKDTQFGKRYSKALKEKKLTSVKLSEVHMINLRGAVAYKDRSEDFHYYFNDAAYCPDTLSAVAMIKDLPVHRKKLIPHLLTAQEKFNVGAVKEDLARKHPIEKYIWRAGMKNESAKEAGRFYFIGQGAPKVVLQEVEENVGEFTKYVVGNAVGTRDIKLKEKMQDIASQSKDIPTDFAKLFISFDISKWSPHMSVEIQRDTCEFFAELFDQPWIANLHYLFVNGTCALSSGSYFAHYPLAGSNLEGMMGKTLTYAMVCIMGIAVRKCKEAKLMPSGSEVDLLAFLDDGLGCWVLPKKNFKATGHGILEMVRLVYKACSMELKPSKCYLSDRFFVFLNIMYYGSARLYDHAKTFIKAGIKKTNEILSFPEKIREIGAWASGAATSGGNWIAIYVRYSWEIAKMVYDTLPEYPFDALSGAVHCFLPVALGGFGIHALFSLVSNVARSPFSENVALLKEASIRLPIIRPQVAKSLARPARRKTGVSFMRAPCTVTIAGKVLVESTLSKRLEEKVRKLPASVYLSDVISLEQDGSLEAIGRSFMECRRPLARIMVEEFYNAMPEKLLDSLIAKFKKSDTVASMFGAEFVKSINNKYRADVEKVVMSYYRWVN